MSTPLRPRARTRRGFTLLEVMFSLIVLTMGLMVLMNLQQYVIRSSGHARQLTIATMVAQRWTERLKLDGLQWRLAGIFGELSDAVVLNNTTYLKEVVTAPNVFQSLNVPAGRPESNAFDFQGEDTPNTNGGRPIFFCAAFRPAWVFYGRALRVDVRVWWAREEYRAPGGASEVPQIFQDFSRCSQGHAALNPGGALFNKYHVVYIPTVIKVNPPI